MGISDCQLLFGRYAPRLLSFLLSTLLFPFTSHSLSLLVCYDFLRCARAHCGNDLAIKNRRLAFSSQMMLVQIASVIILVLLLYIDRFVVFVQGGDDRAEELFEARHVSDWWQGLVCCACVRDECC